MLDQPEEETLPQILELWGGWGRGISLGLRSPDVMQAWRQQFPHHFPTPPRGGGSSSCCSPASAPLRATGSLLLPSFINHNRDFTVIVLCQGLPKGCLLCCQGKKEDILTWARCLLRALLLPRGSYCCCLPSPLSQNLLLNRLIFLSACDLCSQ